MTSDYHRQRTGEGFKRAVGPYWRHWRRGKEKALACPFHETCLKFLFGQSKRKLYGVCPECLNMEGCIRAREMQRIIYGIGKYSSAHYSRKSGTFEQQLNMEKRRMERTHQDWALKRVDEVRELDMKFQELRQKAIVEKTISYDQFQKEKDKWLSGGWEITRMPSDFPKKDKITLRPKKVKMEV